MFNVDWIKNVDSIKNASLFKEMLQDKNFLTSKSNTTFLLGKNSNKIVVFDTLEKAKCIVIVGATGSGKTCFLHTLILSLLLKSSSKNEFLLIDPKFVELDVFDGLKNCKRDSKIDDIYNDLQNLKTKIQSKQCDKNIVLVIDEVMDLLFYDYNKFYPLLKFIVENGPNCGVYPIVTIQNVGYKFFTKEFYNLFNTKIAFRLANKEDSKLVGVNNAENLTELGEFIFLQNPLVTNLKCGYISIKDIENIKQHLI